MASAKEDARLRAQIEFLSGDQHVMREAEPWRSVEPAERLAALVRLCRQLARFRAHWPADVRARAEEPEPLPADALALLERLRACSRS